MAEEPYVIEDAHLIALAEEAEAIHDAEMIGRNPSWPSAAAVNYALMAQTCRRFARLPHQP